MGRVSTLAMYKLEIIVNFMVYYVLHNETLRYSQADKNQIWISDMS